MDSSSESRVDTASGSCEPEILPRAIPIYDRGEIEGALRIDLRQVAEVKPDDIPAVGEDFAYLVDFPERYDSGPIAGRAVVYSVACVPKECLTGTPPFSVSSIGRMIKSHLRHATVGNPLPFAEEVRRASGAGGAARRPPTPVRHRPSVR